MTIVEISPNAAIFSNPDSEEAELQNLMLNIMGGLEYRDLSEEEKALLQKHGYKP